MLGLRRSLERYGHTVLGPNRGSMDLSPLDRAEREVPPTQNM
jgi:hypothetical protein